MISPGMAPAIRMAAIEMPDRLPSSTARLDGGISMAIPPVPRIGPIAIELW